MVAVKRAKAATGARKRAPEGRERGPGPERRANQILRVFVDALPNFGFCFDREGKILRVLSGPQSSETRALEGKKLSRMLPPEDAANLGAALAQTFDRGEGLHFEFVLSVLATRRWYQVKTSLAKMPGEKEPFAVFLFNDITNEKLAEGVLKYAQIELGEKRAEQEATEGVFKAIVDHAPFPIFMKDLEGRFTMGNPSFLQRHGLTAEELIGIKAHDFLPKETADQFQQELEQVVSSGEGSETQFWMGFPDGSQRKFVNTRFPVTGRGGQIVGVGTISSDITARVRAEEELKNSQRLLQTVFDLIPQALFVRDQNSRYLMVNRALAQGSGMEPEDLKGRSLLDIPVGTPAQRKHFLETDRWVLTHGERYQEDAVTLTLADGRERIFSRVSLPLKNEAGEVVGLVGVRDDVTDKTAAEAALREEKELLRNILDHTPASIFLKDQDSRYLMVNRSYEQMLGLNSAELIGKTTADFYPAEFAKDFQARDREMMELGTPITWEHTLPIPGGGERWVYSTKFPVNLPSQKKTVIGTIVTDMTERRRAETALAAQEKLLETVLDTIPHWVYAKNRESRYIRVNKPMADSFNHDRQDFVGRETEEFRVHAKVRIGTDAQLAALTEMDRQVLETGHRAHAPEFAMTTGSGEELVFNIIKLPLFDPDNNVVGIVGISEDITERKGLEKRLLQGQKMEALGTMAGGIAHDFNNILQPIIGFADLVKEKINPASREFADLEVVRKSAQRAKELVSNILLFSRGIPPRKEPCDLRVVVEDALRLLRASLPQTIAIQTEFSPEVDWVEGESSRLHQVVLNLGLNAGKAMPDTGQLLISLGNVRLDGFECVVGRKLSGEFVRLAMKDTGTGMDAATLAQIFDPFFSTKNIGEGTGLGLSTVLGIVRDHGGGIAVTSDPGAGSVFEVFLPARKKPVAEAEEKGGALPHGTESILFVDDEEPITKLAKRVLESFGFRVTATNDSLEALQIFCANPEGFDLVVTDQHMPNMKGEQLAAELKKVRPGISIILCTGFTNSVSPETCAEMGIDAFLYKPVALHEMGTLIRGVLDHPPRPDSPASRKATPAVPPGPTRR